MTETPELIAARAARHEAFEVFRPTGLNKAERRYHLQIGRIEALEAQLAAATAKAKTLREKRDAHAAAHPDEAAKKEVWWQAIHAERRLIQALARPSAARATLAA
jgi:hypothetical protein